MKRLFRFRYPKLTLLLIFIIASFFIFSNDFISNSLTNLGDLKYIGIFIAGILFSFGFTTPFAIGFLITSNPSNIILATLIGGIGGTLADLLIFKAIRFSFMDEFNRLEKGHPIKDLNKVIKHSFSHKIRVYLLYILAGIAISSPLPDEIGVTMLAGLSHIQMRTLAIISFILKSVGILVVLLI